MPPFQPSYPELMLPRFLRWSYTEESTRASAVVVSAHYATAATLFTVLTNEIF